MDTTPRCTLSEHSFCLWLYFRSMRTDRSDLPDRPRTQVTHLGAQTSIPALRFHQTPLVVCASPHARCSGSHLGTCSGQAKHLSRYTSEQACLRASRCAALCMRSPCGAGAELSHLPAASGDRAAAARRIAPGEGTRAPPRPRGSTGCGLWN